MTRIHRQRSHQRSPSDFCSLPDHLASCPLNVPTTLEALMLSTREPLAHLLSCYGRLGFNFRLQTPDHRFVDCDFNSDLLSVPGARDIASAAFKKFVAHKRFTRCVFFFDILPSPDQAAHHVGVCGVDSDRALLSVYEPHTLLTSDLPAPISQALGTGFWVDAFITAMQPGAVLQPA